MSIQQEDDDSINKSIQKISQLAKITQYEDSSKTLSLAFYDSDSEPQDEKKHDIDSTRVLAMLEGSDYDSDLQQEDKKKPGIDSAKVLGMLEGSDDDDLPSTS